MPQSENENRYALLAADSSPVALVVLSDQGRRIQYANGTFRRLVAEPDVVGRALTELLSGNAIETLTPLLDAVRETGLPRRCPGVFLNGTTSWDIAAAPLPSDPELTPPEIIALWLWPETAGAVQSRHLAEVLRDGLTASLPTSEVDGFEFGAALIPSEPGAALGGDTFDIVPLGEGRWGLFLADVCGRGPVPAARAVMLRHSARVLLPTHGPGATLTRLSRLLMADTSFAGFATAFLGILDTREESLTFSIAGHEPALLLRGGPDPFFEEVTGNGALPLAVDEEVVYPDRSIVLTRRDLLLLYTDGLTDTRRDEEFYDQTRLRDALLSHRAIAAPALVALLLAEASAFAGPKALRDDTALLAVRGVSA